MKHIQPRKVRYNNLIPNVPQEPEEEMPLNLSPREELHELVDALDDDDIPNATWAMLCIMGKC